MSDDDDEEETMDLYDAPCAGTIGRPCEPCSPAAYTRRPVVCWY